MMKEFDSYDEYREPPQGCGSAIAGGIAIVVIALLLCFSGCRTVQPIAHSRDSVRVEVRHDSVYVLQRDSVYVDRWRNGDTVFVTLERWRTEYREKIVMQHDTVAAERVQVVTERYVPKYYTRTSAGFWALLVIVLAFAAIKIAKIWM